MSANRILTFLIMFLLISSANAFDQGENKSITDDNKLSDECSDLKIYPQNKIYEKIGVYECCFALAVIVQAEGYFSGSVPVECSEKEMDKIYEFCEKNDSCW